MNTDDESHNDFRFIMFCRLCIYMILCSVPGCFTFLAPERSSWTLISRGTTGRSIVNWAGLQHVKGVAKANKMMSRLLSCNKQTVLGMGYGLFRMKPRVTALLYVATACKNVWMIEQPQGSEQVFVLQSRFQRFCNEVAYVSRLHRSILALQLNRPVDICLNAAHTA